MANVENGQLLALPFAGTCALVKIVSFAHAPNVGLPAGLREAHEFIANGAGPGRARQADSGYDPSARCAAIRSMYHAFQQLHTAFGMNDTQVDIVLVDVPLVPAAVVKGIPSPFRPVRSEAGRSSAFGNKVYVPGQARLTSPFFNQEWRMVVGPVTRFANRTMRLQCEDRRRVLSAAHIGCAGGDPQNRMVSRLSTG